MSRKIVRRGILTTGPLTVTIIPPDPLRFFNPFRANTTVSRFGFTTCTRADSLCARARMRGEGAASGVSVPDPV